MSFLSLNLLPNAVGQGQERIVYAEVSPVQPAPANFSDPLFVIIPDWSPDFYFEIPAGSWSAVHGNALPQQGASCILIGDSRGNWRVTGWDGATTFPSTLPSWVNVKDSGAKGDGATDDTAAIISAITSLGPNGGTLFFPPGVYILSSLSLNNLRSIVIRGVGGRSSGAQTATRIVFTGTSTALTAQNIAGFSLIDCQVLYNNVAFTGSLIDVSGGAYITIERCNLGGIGTTSAAQAVNFLNTQAVRVLDTKIGSSVVGVLGRGVVTDFANGVSFTNTTFTNISTASVKNAGDGWSFTGCIFENLSGGGAGAFISDATVPAKALSLMGCWFGDGGTTGTWINYVGGGLLVAGNEIGSGSIGIRLPAGINGATIVGNKFHQIQDNAVFFTSGAAGSNCVIAGNDVSTVVGTPVGYGATTLPTQSVLQEDAQGTMYLTSMVLGVAGAVSDVNFAVPPPDHTMAYDTTNNQLYFRTGGVWKKSAAFT